MSLRIRIKIAIVFGVISILPILLSQWMLIDVCATMKPELVAKCNMAHVLSLLPLLFIGYALTTFKDTLNAIQQTK